MNLSDEIRKQIEKNKGLKLAVGEINNHLSILEGLVRNDIEGRKNEAYQKGYDAGIIASSFVDKSDEAYQRGLNDAWEAARKIADMWTRIDNDELLAIFGITERIGHSTIMALFEKQTANEAMLELEVYEEKQKADDEIKVGDEVAFHHDDGRPDTVVVVTHIGQDGFIDGMDGRGTQYAHKNPTKWTKTGRHFDITSILKEMQS